MSFKLKGQNCRDAGRRAGMRDSSGGKGGGGGGWSEQSAGLLQLLRAILAKFSNHL
jgi:hypothetical protein